MVKVPFAGEKGEGLINDLSRTLQRNLPDKIKCRIVRTGSKLQQKFNIKDKLQDKHKSDLVYYHECQNKNCDDDYVGETERRKEMRTGGHGGKNKNRGFSNIRIVRSTQKLKTRTSRYWDLGMEADEKEG